MGPRILYLSQMELPSKSAHSIQILKTCAALSHLGLKVVLVVERGILTPKQVQELYGVMPSKDGFSVVESRRTTASLLRLCGVFLPHIPWNRPPATILYTRSQRWARLAIRTRPLHRLPVVFETHRKAGIFKNDPETGREEPLERRKRVEWIFRRADGVVCAAGATHRGLLAQGVRSLHLWYGWTHTGFWSRGPLFSLAYAGTKDLDLVLDAFGRIPQVKLTVYGVPGEMADRLSPPPNVELEGFLPHAALLERLGGHGGFIATNEGIKLADYLSFGGLVFAPDLPSVREVLKDGAFYFRFGDAASLAMSIQGALASPRLCQLASRRLVKRGAEFAWPGKGKRLRDFLFSLLP